MQGMFVSSLNSVMIYVDRDNHSQSIVITGKTT